jgi:hypothetical protein
MRKIEKLHVCPQARCSCRLPLLARLGRTATRTATYAVKQVIRYLCMPAKQHDTKGHNVYRRQGGMQLPWPRVFWTLVP